MIKKILNHLPLGNIILFESVPNLSDNTKAVFDEMIRRNMNQTYQLIWVLNKEEKNLPKIHNVKYLLYKYSTNFTIYRFNCGFNIVILVYFFRKINFRYNFNIIVFTVVDIQIVYFISYFIFYN